MINLTDKLHFIEGDDKLEAAIQHSIRRAVVLLEQSVGRTAGRADYQEFAFVTMFRDGTLPDGAKYDKVFVEVAFQTSQLAPGATSKLPAELASYSTAKSPPASGLASLKRGLKLFLFELWHQGALLLPTVFNPGPCFPYEHFSHPLLDWLRAFDPKGSGDSGDSRRMHYYAPRLLWATNWKTAKDVSLNEIAMLTRARVLHKHGKSTAAIAGWAALPLGLFAAHLIRAFPEEASFSDEDLARYSNWSLSHAIGKASFDDYVLDPTSSQKKGAHPAAPTRGRVRAPQPDQNFNGEDSHEVLIRNFLTLKGGSRSRATWQSGEVASYQGREHVDISSIASGWSTCFSAFLLHRELIKGYRSNAAVVSALNFLADYLFYYLPWWIEIATDAKVALPRNPRMLSRFAFVARHTSAPWTEMPATLLELLRLRRPNNASAKATVHHLSLFFDFVGTHFADDEQIAGSAFRSPIKPEFDAPRIETKNKTTKEVIPKQIYGYLLFYCYAVEEFGMHLEALVKAGNPPAERRALRDALRFNTQALGFVPRVSYRGRALELVTVPNVFTWAERELKDGASSSIVYMPHCSALRLLITALETGLRAQSVQWLDKASWRSLGVDTPEDSYTFPLLVNTDKTKTSNWRTYVVHRVKELLTRQEEFQAQFVDADAFGPINYEGLDASPFDSIRPLFRAVSSAIPLSDGLYDKYWRKLMVDFEAFYREVTGERHVRMFKLQPRLQDDGTPVVQGLGAADERPYCPISVLAVHTPHACRATFATNRKGVLELSDTAELLGHSNEVVTAHYDKPDEADLRDRLASSDSEIVAEFIQRVADANVYVRADKPDSALVKSFSTDREATMDAFRFMPPIALWSLDDSRAEADGLKLLREGPMSKIRFRETHICPVGEECPSEILEQIGEPRRCGSCPLAMKCVDHLTAIAAKRNQLLERIRYQHRHREQLEAAGEPISVLDAIWEAIELDVNELLGCKRPAIPS